MHGVRGLSQSDYKPVGNRVTFSMCCHVMRQQEQPTEQRRTRYLKTSSTVQYINSGSEVKVDSRSTSAEAFNFSSPPQ